MHGSLDWDSTSYNQHQCSFTFVCNSLVSHFLVTLYFHCWLVQRNATNVKLISNFLKPVISLMCRAWHHNRIFKIKSKSKSWLFMKCQFHSYATHLVFVKQKHYYLNYRFINQRLCTVYTSRKLIICPSFYIYIYIYDLSCCVRAGVFPSIYSTGCLYHIGTYKR